MENLSENLFRERLLLNLPYQVEPSHQVSIIREVVQNGSDLGVWHSYPIRGCKSLNDLEAYDNRLNSELPWEYFQNPLKDLVQELVSPLCSFYSPTRIKIFVQKPNESLREHCDKLEYKNNALFRDFLKTEQFHDFFVEPFHQAQKCLTIKIPLSEIPGDNGKGYFLYQGMKYYLKPGNNFYMFNESKLRHGADPCSHFRGVIFLDGVINLVELEKIKLSAVPIVKAENV